MCMCFGQTLEVTILQSVQQLPLFVSGGGGGSGGGGRGGGGSGGGGGKRESGGRIKRSGAMLR